ncbi:MAG TPA: hypothetical protein PKU78_04985 [Candidatus Dojkabacteria bacterium]|nr:hypothetical protein [Candidatus Dojkabacteria bacterium]HRO65549.1 hypothetical protein [Candidatus Dojkabacteria bacterium]HRP36459.1 hypothetical protein [Candidatus Dojkabacteria bacterium]HRP51856.1 hypothetical protein [Candidatus Dojkabacteria bacterium]
MIKTYSLPESARKVIFEFTNLPIADKKIIAPYYINTKSQRGGLRVLSGKGDPGEIAREVKVQSQLKGIDLYKLSESQIRDFMTSNHIGIECSGFIVHVLNYWLRMNGKRPLIKYIRFNNNNFINRIKRLFRPVEQLGANTITSELNCDKLHRLTDIRPGDLIRSKGQRKNSHHILLISEVTFEDDVLKEVEYVHSIRGYEEENGVRFGKILINNQEDEIQNQTWTEIKNGRNWTYEGLINQLEDNGVRRLKHINLRELEK